MSFIVTPPSASAAERGLGGEVDGVLVGVLAELGHVDPEDPDVVAHGVLLSLSCSRRGSKPKPMASVPVSSVPSE